MKRLNHKGISHLLVPLLIVVAVGIVGTYLLVSSHADSVTAPTSTTAGTNLIYNPADTSVPANNWPDESQIPEVTSEPLSASASSASNKGVKKYTITVIGKKDGGLCNSGKTTAGCKKGSDTYHRVSTSNDTLYVYTNTDGKCTVNIPVFGNKSVTVKQGVHKLGKINRGLKAKCTFAKGQYYNFALAHKKKFIYWGSGNKKMQAWDQVGTFGSKGKSAHANYIVLGSEQ